MTSKQFLAIITLLFSFITNSIAGGIPNIPQIPAFLPTVDSVPATKPMPLDGTWLITSIGKKIRIESGRAYAVDGWLHLFTLQVQPGMVVIKNITPTGPGQYSGEDLPLMGQWSAKVQANRSIAVTVAGMLGPVNYTLMPVQIDKPNWYAQEMAAAGLTAPPPSDNTETPVPPAYEPAPPANEPTPEITPPSPQPIQPIDDDDEDEVEVSPPEDDDDDDYEDPEDIDVGEIEEGEEEEEAAAETKPIKAKDHGAYACRGKNLYYSKVNGKKGCYSCPKGYTRFSPTRKMSHAKACTLRQKGKNLYAKAKYQGKYHRSCKKGQFKHGGHCKSCPTGYRPQVIQRMDIGPAYTGKCVLNKN